MYIYDLFPRHTGDPTRSDIIKTCSFRLTLRGAASAEREVLANQKTKATKVNPAPDQSNVSNITVRGAKTQGLHRHSTQ